VLAAGRRLAARLGRRREPLGSGDDRVVGSARTRPAARPTRAADDHHFRAVVDAAGDSILTMDPDATVLSFNRVAEAMTGWAADEVVGRNALDLLEQEEAAPIATHIDRVLASGLDVVEPIRTQVRRKDGSAWPAEFTVSRVSLPERDLFTVIARDISERQRLEQQLTHQALHDPLTGLANRALLVDRLGSALRRAERTGRWPALLFLDLDRFKVINDSLGHHVGDELLMIVAHRLSAELRASDTAARLGGDEFVALCEDLDAEEARQLAHRLLEVVVRPVDLDRAEAVVTASIGLVIAEPDTTPESLLRDADASMYRAKADGRNRFHVFDESIRAAAVSRLTLESGLRRAVADEELELWFQPQYDAVDLRMVGAEALLRWRHPERGLLPPEEFLPVAEEVGLDRSIDEWVLRAAATSAGQWVAANPDFVLWVNVSARALADPGFTAVVLGALADAGLEPVHLGLEVTERGLLLDMDLAAQSLDALRRAGVRIAIDDFGTGFSSLSWLERLPLDVLKIDRSFTERLGTTRDETVIVRSVVAMAHNLGLRALAEGVEDHDQLERLRELGCDLVQGYLLSRPMPGPLVHPVEAPLVPSGGVATP
jgi:diguanylate cyclase (GGDEF)-like protein/PAS domain S-box-containing protein